MNFLNIFKSFFPTSSKPQSFVCVYSLLPQVENGDRLTNKDCDYETPSPIIGMVYTAERVFSDKLALVVPPSSVYGFTFTLQKVSENTLGLLPMIRKAKHKLWFLQKDLNLITPEQATRVQERMYEILNKEYPKINRRRYQLPLDIYSVDTYYVKMYEELINKQT